MNTQITVSAIIHADVKKVWDYYTLPEHITQWNYALDSWHCPYATNDLRVGGRYLARMEAKDGSVGFDFDAIYTDVQPYERLSYVFGERHATVSFKKLNAQTEVIVTFDPEQVNPIELQQRGWQAILNNFKIYTETH